MEDDKLKFIRSVYFFAGLADSEIQKILDVCRNRTFQEGEIIFEEGSVAQEFYIILQGEVEIWKDYHKIEKDLLAVSRKGQLVGEMALIDELPRSATVIACSTTELLCMDKKDFQDIIQDNSSIALSIMKSVSNMVRKSNDSYVQRLRARNRELEKTNMELKETQEELLQMERLSTLGKFSSLILHDIRNPLSILKGYAELIQMRADDTERVKKCSVKIIGEANRLNRIASELLDYSRGEIRLNMQIVNLKDFVDSVLEAIKDRYVAQQINVVTEITYTGPVLMDNERMHRVLFNLADNARKAMPNGGKLFIKIVEEKENYTITIRDTGVGMTSEVKNRIFEPFFSYSKKGGTGLGMSIVQSIVDAHNGSLKVESKVNVGTKFSIMMPKYS